MYFSTSYMYVGCTLVLFGILSSALNSFPSLACLGHLRLSFGHTHPQKKVISLFDRAQTSLPYFLLSHPLQEAAKEAPPWLNMRVGAKTAPALRGLSAPASCQEQPSKNS